MDVSDYIGFVAAEGNRFAAAADRGDLDVEIPRCEGWNMRDLVRHFGLIHLWAAAIVETTSKAPTHAPTSGWKPRSRT